MAFMTQDGEVEKAQVSTCRHLVGDADHASADGRGRGNTRDVLGKEWLCHLSDL